MQQKDLDIILGDTEVGRLSVRGNISRFNLLDSYKQMENRPVLGQFFEEDLEKEYKSNMNLHAWFSNLLPEGRLRDWIARDLDQNSRSISEVKLLERLGSDLPGAVKIIDAKEPTFWHPTNLHGKGYIENSDGKFRFSLAGVAMKFSTIRDGDRFVAPAKYGADKSSQEWILKLPEPHIPGLCVNEYYSMKLAAAVGLSVPSVELIEHKNVDAEIKSLHSGISEPCYAIERFDRSSEGRIHIEDFCQVLGKRPEQKYESSFETIINVIVNRSSEPAKDYREAIKRILFNYVLDNGDAHLKNWSFIYPNGNIARLSPLYDVSSTGMHATTISGMDHDLGLKLNNNKRFARVSRDDFIRIEQKILKDRNLYDESEFGDINKIIDSFLENINDIFTDFSNSVDNLEWVNYVGDMIKKRSEKLK